MSDYFGQSPDGYQKPLYGASNLADVVDKPTALTNLGAASKDDVLKAANPIGTIIAFYGSVAPYGYLPCSGQTVSSSTFPALVTFLGGTTSATLPDLRGEFLRGWDNGRGIDTGRTLNSWQKGSILVGDFDGNGSNAAFSATTIGAISGDAALRAFGLDSSSVSDYTGAGYVAAAPSTAYALTAGYSGSVRPRNVSVLYCIKAYDCPVNIGTLNVATLASEMALKAALVDFTGTNQSLSANGWQKLPGGLIIQWGTTAGVTSGGSITVTFPLAFPNKALSATLGFYAAAAIAQQSFATNVGLGSSTTTMTVYGIGNFQPVQWIAIGY